MQVFGSSPSGEMNEKFWDILAFCLQVSKLMVTEIRRRASNQSTEAASCAIAKFLEIENNEESSNGWMLLSTLNLLAAGDQSLVQVCTLYFLLLSLGQSPPCRPGTTLQKCTCIKAQNLELLKIHLFINS